MNITKLFKCYPELDEILETVVAVDIGTSYVKTDELTFRSTIKESFKKDFYSTRLLSIQWDDTFYTLGDSYSYVNLKATDFRTKEYKLCLLTAIAFNFARKTKLRDLKIRLAVGLPAEYYETYHKELEAEIRKLGKQSIRIDCQYENASEITRPFFIDDGTMEHKWTDYEIEILEVVVFMQGATIYKNINNDLKFPLTVIDIGSHLLNVSNWNLDEATSLLINTRTLNNIGFYKPLHDLTIKLSCIEGFSYLFDENDTIKLLNASEIDCSDDTVIQEIKDTVLKSYVDKLIDLLRYAKFDINTNVLLIGGPAKTILNYFTDKLPNSTINLLEDISTEYKNNYYSESSNAFLYYQKYKELLTSNYTKANTANKK